MNENIAPVRHSLSKPERLHRKKIIEQLFEKGEAIKTPALILIYKFLPLPAEVPLQVLFSVSKKNYRHAHDRNRVKRLMREGYRKNKIKIQQKISEQKMQAALMFIFTGRQLPDQNYVQSKIIELLNRFSALVSKQQGI